MNFSSPINVITVLFSDVHYRLSDISIWRLTSYFMENTLGTNQEIISLLFFFSSCVALSIFFFLDFNHFYFDLFRVLGWTHSIFLQFCLALLFPLYFDVGSECVCVVYYTVLYTLHFLSEYLFMTPPFFYTFFSIFIRYLNPVSL